MRPVIQVLYCRHKNQYFHHNLNFLTKDWQSDIGWQTFVQKTFGKQTLGQLTLGQQTFVQQTFVQQTFTQLIFGQQTFGQQIFGQQTFGQQIFGQQIFGQQTLRQQTFSQQPFVQQPFVQQPFVQPGNTKGGSITVLLTSGLTGLGYSDLQIKTKIVSFHTAYSKPVKQEVNSKMILSPLVFPGPTDI